MTATLAGHVPCAHVNKHLCQRCRRKWMQESFYFDLISAMVSCLSGCWGAFASELRKFGRPALPRGRYELNFAIGEHFCCRFSLVCCTWAILEPTVAPGTAKKK